MRAITDQDAYRTKRNDCMFSLGWGRREGQPLVQGEYPAARGLSNGAYISLKKAMTISKTIKRTIAHSSRIACRVWI